jgi:hypothetical protein
MNIKSNLKIMGMALTVSAFTFACNTETRNETNREIDEAQVEMNETGREVDREYNDFSVWVDEQSNRAETATEAEWRETKAEYNRREAELDAKSDTWDDDTRRGWEDVKARWNRTENKAQERFGKIDVDVDVNRRKN